MDHKNIPNCDRCPVAQIRPGYLRREAAARYCGVSLRTIADWQAEHRIPFIRVSHRIVLFKIVELEAALDRLMFRARGQ